ncbi:MAG: O-succinylhomoserine sulfhydrylase [Pseudorhodobacter sp.]|nr:O-succinylhomoserine sulfhydrylase [Rhizobacter sp.]
MAIKKIPRVALPADARPDTLAVREGLPRTQWGENSEALFMTSSFVQPNAATAAGRFANEEEAFTYSRFTNPTVMMFERRLAAMEKTEACIATASGMSAILLLGMGLLKAGDHVICSQSVFGSTIMLLSREFGKFGVETTFVSQTDAAEWQAAVRPNTKLLFAESPTNPLTDICDIKALSFIAKAAGAWLAVDNCFCSPALQRPVEYGADIVIHSGTKYLDGQGRVIAGALCASEQLVTEKFVPVMRTAGMSLSPFNAWVVLKGLETLSIRMRAQSSSAQMLAAWLETQPMVERVFYPGLKSHPQHELAMAQQSGSGGAVLSFIVKGAKSSDALVARQGAFHVIDSTQVCSITANLGDTKTTITHPASTSHGRLTEDQRQAAGISQAMIRVAVGLDDIEDLKTDLLRGLNSLAL